MTIANLLIVKEVRLLESKMPFRHFSDKSYFVVPSHGRSRYC